MKAKTRFAERYSIRVKPVSDDVVQITVVDAVTQDVWQKQWFFKKETDVVITNYNVAIEKIAALQSEIEHLKQTKSESLREEPSIDSDTETGIDESTSEPVDEQELDQQEVDQKGEDQNA